MSEIIVILAAERVPSALYKFPSLPLPLSPQYTMAFTFARLSRAPAPCIRLARRTTPLRTFSTTPARHVTLIPTTATCPSPTCECASSPADLDIDRKSPLLNTVAAYSEQVILSTGQEDWHSNIEQEDGATGTFVKGLKGVIGKGGEAFDVCVFPLPHFRSLCSLCLRTAVP
jgi:hypothetical protein